MADLKKIVEDIKGLSLVEVSDLVKLLEEEFGVSAAAVMASAPTAQGDAPAAEEKTEFDVVLKAFDATQKIGTIRLLKDMLGLGLVECKALVENAPSVIKEAVPTAQAKEYEEKLKAVGATVELK